MAGLRVLGGWWRKLPLIDRVLLLCACLLVCASFSVFLGLESGRHVNIYVEDRLVYTLPLDSEREFGVEGPLGETRIGIEKGAVRVLSSPCPNKACLRMGRASHAHDLIACVPNRVVITIVGKETHGGGYDLLSQ
jgi:hypothetical protein